MRKSTNKKSKVTNSTKSKVSDSKNSRSTRNKKTVGFVSDTKRTTNKVNDCK